MKNIVLTEREKKVVALFASMPTSVKPRLPAWALEIGFPIALALYGMISRQPVFLSMAVGGLVALNAQRMFRQFTFSKELKAICAKLQAHMDQESVAHASVQEDGPASGRLAP